MVGTNQLAGTMKIIVMWSSPPDRIVPRSEGAQELIQSLNGEDSLLTTLFSARSYGELRARALRRENVTVRLPLGDGKRETLVWEFVPGRGGIACIAMNWKIWDILSTDENTIYQQILLNILPEYIVKELVSKRAVQPKVYRHSTILFTDVVRFSRLSFHLDPVTLIRKLDSYFSYYDDIMDEFGMEKIKTIGDAYMCVSGVPVKKKSHAVDCCLAALKIREVMKRREEPILVDGTDINNWSIRIGIHSGPCISGVVGNKKYTFDIWGDSVNIAAGMEHSGEPGRINISESTFREVCEFFECRFRGKQDIHHIGLVRMYFLDSLKPEYSDDGITPNDAFRRVYRKTFYHKDTKNSHAVMPAILREPVLETT